MSLSPSSPWPVLFLGHFPLGVPDGRIDQSYSASWFLHRLSPLPLMGLIFPSLLSSLSSAHSQWCGQFLFLLRKRILARQRHFPSPLYTKSLPLQLLPKSFICFCFLHGSYKKVQSFNSAVWIPEGEEQVSHSPLFLQHLIIWQAHGKHLWNKYIVFQESNFLMKPKDEFSVICSSLPEFYFAGFIPQSRGHLK